MPLNSPWTLTVEALRVQTSQVYRDLALPQEQIIYEPRGRNTAPAIALLCQLFSLKGKGSEIVGVFPADHLITDEQEFRKAVELSMECAQKGMIVTLGIKPTRPAVEFGY